MIDKNIRAIVISMLKIITFIFLLFPLLAQPSEESSEDYPEAHVIDQLLRGEKPEGIVFLVMEYDIEALGWVLPRVLHYTKELKGKWPGLEIVILSHGDEMFVLQKDYVSAYQNIHHQIEMLVEKHDVLFQVCGSYAQASNISVTNFPRYIDVVPYAPTEIDNYRLLDYKLIHLDHTW
jgi:intracellular sulfur oxidation DsrE/DsrF family protein